MTDKLPLRLALIRIATTILVGILVLFYFMLSATEILYISHAIEHVTPFFQARNQETEDALKELQTKK